MIGASIRLALALGLHLRNEDPKADISRKETLKKTWWTLHLIEYSVSAITGRPPIIVYDDCTVSLPGEQVSSGGVHTKRANTRSTKAVKSSKTPGDRRHYAMSDQYLLDHIKITIISQEVLINLYSPRTAVKSWQTIESLMSKALEKLQKWQENAIDTHTRSFKGKQKANFDRQQLLLRIEFWSTKMLITRPCLCRLEQRIRNENNASVEFNGASAKLCVEAALEMTKLFPDVPDIDFIYSQGPWWSVNHFSKFIPRYICTSKAHT
jgi:hypothetical protein